MKTNNFLKAPKIIAIILILLFSLQFSAPALNTIAAKPLIPKIQTNPLSEGYTIQNIIKNAAGRLTDNSTDGVVTSATYYEHNLTTALLTRKINNGYNAIRNGVTVDGELNCFKTTNDYNFNMDEWGSDWIVSAPSKMVRSYDTVQLLDDSGSYEKPFASFYNLWDTNNNHSFEITNYSFARQGNYIQIGFSDHANITEIANYDTRNYNDILFRFVVTFTYWHGSLALWVSARNTDGDTVWLKKSGEFQSAKTPIYFGSKDKSISLSIGKSANWYEVSAYNLTTGTCLANASIARTAVNYSNHLDAITIGAFSNNRGALNSIWNKCNFDNIETAICTAPMLSYFVSSIIPTGNGNTRACFLNGTGLNAKYLYTTFDNNMTVNHMRSLNWGTNYIASNYVGNYFVIRFNIIGSPGSISGFTTYGTTSGFVFNQTTPCYVDEPTCQREISINFTTDIYVMPNNYNYDHLTEEFTLEFYNCQIGFRGGVFTRYTDSYALDLPNITIKFENCSIYSNYGSIFNYVYYWTNDPTLNMVLTNCSIYNAYNFLNSSLTYNSCEIVHNDIYVKNICDYNMTTFQSNYIYGGFQGFFKYFEGIKCGNQSYNHYNLYNGGIAIHFIHDSFDASLLQYEIHHNVISNCTFGIITGGDTLFSATQEYFLGGYNCAGRTAISIHHNFINNTGLISGFGIACIKGETNVTISNNWILYYEIGILNWNYTSYIDNYDNFIYNCTYGGTALGNALSSSFSGNTLSKCVYGISNFYIFHENAINLKIENNDFIDITTTAISYDFNDTLNFGNNTYTGCLGIYYHLENGTAYIWNEENPIGKYIAVNNGTFHFMSTVSFVLPSANNRIKTTNLCTGHSTYNNETTIYKTIPITYAEFNGTVFITSFRTTIEIPYTYATVYKNGSETFSYFITKDNELCFYPEANNNYTIVSGILNGQNLDSLTDSIFLFHDVGVLGLGHIGTFLTFFVVFTVICFGLFLASIGLALGKSSMDNIRLR